MICYEAILPGYVREPVRRGADLLVNLRGVHRFRDGDNRELPIRGSQGL